MKIKSYIDYSYNELFNSLRRFSYNTPSSCYFKHFYLDDINKTRCEYKHEYKYNMWDKNREHVFNVYLNIKDAIRYANENDIDIILAGKMLIGHEIMHVALGHFSDKYKDYDRKLLNIAGDLEINTILGINHPGIIPEDFGFPKYLNTEMYYELLKKQQKENPEEFEKNSQKAESDNNDDTEDSGFQINHDIDENSQEIPYINLDNSVYRSEGKDDNPGQISNILNNFANKGNKHEKHEKDFNIKLTNIKDLDKVLHRMIANEQSFSIVQTKKVPSYYKFNNRRKSNFILPGKKVVQHGNQKKFQKKLTVFLDVSGSTYDNQDLKTVAYELHKLGATIVYYDTKICDILEPNEPHCHFRPSGGTDVTACIKEYLNDGNKLDRLYVFTDGADYFYEIPRICSDFEIYKLVGNTCRQITKEEIERSNGRWI